MHVHPPSGVAPSCCRFSHAVHATDIMPLWSAERMRIFRDCPEQLASTVVHQNSLEPGASSRDMWTRGQSGDTACHSGFGNPAIVELVYSVFLVLDQDDSNDDNVLLDAGNRWQMARVPGAYARTPACQRVPCACGIFKEGIPRSSQILKFRRNLARRVCRAVVCFAHAHEDSRAGQAPARASGMRATSGL